MSYILSIDQGTTGTTACLIDTKTFKICNKSNKEFTQIFPKPGHVEHDLNEIWDTVSYVVEDVISKSKIDKSEILSIGITNQRETTCAFSKSTHSPLANAIVWQDRRTHEKCVQLKANNLEPFIKKATGLTLDPYFSATKMQWLTHNNTAVQDAIKNDDLYLGTIDTYLLYRLTNGRSFCTEATNASRTLLMDIKTGEWNKELLSTFEIKSKWLPQIKNSIGDFGSTSNLNFLPDGIKITGILGDQQSALFGQAGFEEGDMKCTYGTGAFMLLNTGEEIKYSNSGLLTTVAYKFNDKHFYALEGSSYIAGAAVQWLRDNLSIIEDAKDSETLALEVKNLEEMENLLFLPFFTGIGSPHWVSNAQATITGITRDTNKSHIARACLDGICLSINDLISAMEKDIEKEIKYLNVDGGAVENNLLMNIQASISNIEIIRPEVIETTAYGAALAAAIGIDIIKIEDLKDLWKKEATFTANKKWSEFYKEKKSQWSKTIERLYL